MVSIATNLHRIRARINALNPRVKLIAVTKNRPPQAIKSLYAAGQRLFGENRIQEAQRKYPPLKADCPDLRLHLIGALQRNKVNVAASGMFAGIHSLDRPKLAERLAFYRTQGATIPPLFIQVNIGAEPQKDGVIPERAEPLLRLAERLELPVVGLMAIPPLRNSGGYFASLRRLQRKLGLEELSMGMSDDFEEAIKAGATCVRVGSALFAP